MAMASARIGINGFGRIGFCSLRLAMERGLDVVALNASRTPKEIALLYTYDSTHGTTTDEVTYDDNSITIGGTHHIVITSERDNSKIPWGELGVDYVIESTGKFLTYELAHPHIEAGAKKVVLSAPSKDPNISMYVYGVNHETYSGEEILSAASCTTNCLAPLAKVVNDNFGIQSGLMNTIHAVTSKQPSVDGYNAKDPRIARAASSIIPSTTGAAIAVGKVLPELNGKLTGISTRVPVIDGSMVDLTVNLEKPSSYEEICEAIKKASQGEMKGIIKYIDDPLVSSDFIGEHTTCCFDATAGVALSENFVKLIAWYDNEYGYTNQLLNLLEHVISVDG